MSWELLLLLACPLMMLFCMKGMFTGNKDKKSASNNVAQQGVQQSDIQSIQVKMEELMEQNHELMTEINEMKKAQGNNGLQKEGPRLKAVKE
jgi:FtsZ-binding cell division protein ZapB